MLTLATIFGLLGNITTGLVYLAPVNTFWHIIQIGSTEEFDSLPYVAKLLNGCMWVYYGVVKPNSVLVATVNGFGALLELIYVIIFLIFAPPKMRKTVVTTKSVEYMPFLLSFILFINGLTWTVYAVITRDWFIGIPNGSGFVFGTAQLVLYAMYWRPKQSKKTLDHVVEEGCPTEHLLDHSGPLLHKYESRAVA
ncbi:bidirectional sugar transporter SWEET17-like [Hibiscus syriacus]|uniref:bidirectional sugar transporter SWEET17-like n=1 Tax=Hibiscus syriacus TaxID=106335 RepID=UPI00192515FA|nr:bidirectional sugar transporter SWEET17-like [Hibiscus syriacus]